MMNKDPGTPEDRLFAWLMPDPSLTSPSAQEKSARLDSDLDKREANNLEVTALDPIESEAVNELSSALGRLEGSNPPFKLGEIPAVQDRFHALLKRRLQAEIQRHPPLFPWETEVADYSNSLESSLVGLFSGHIWGTQLRNLNLPVPLPEKILAHLLAECQVVMQSSLQQGAKLVQAVESLFPEQSQSLNQLAGLVLMSPSRSPQGQQLVFAPETEFPSSYDAATPNQQMLLSLLAAQEIMGSLTLIVSPQKPLVERQWLTAAGLLNLKVQYQPQEQSVLKVQGELPCEGNLRLTGGGIMVAAQCPSAGQLSVEISNFLSEQRYSLEVGLQQSDQPPLVFAIHPTQ